MTIAVSCERSASCNSVILSLFSEQRAVDSNLDVLNTIVRGKRRLRRSACVCMYFRRSSGMHCLPAEKQKGGNRCFGGRARRRDTRTDPALSIVAVRAGDAFVNSHSVANIDAAKRWRDTHAPLCSFMISLLSSHKIFFFISS